MLFLSLLWVVGIMLTTSICFQLLEGGKLVEHEPFRVFDKTNLSMWGISAAFGIVVGAIQYFIPQIREHLWLAPVFLTVMLAAMVAVIIWGRTRACEVKEFFCLGILLLFLTLATKATAVATTALVTQPFWASLILILPWLVFVAGIGVYVVFFFYYGEKLTVGRIFMGIFTVILAIMLIFGCAWRNFPIDFSKDTKTIDSVAKEVGNSEDDELASQAAIIMSLSDAEFETILEKSGLKGAVLNRNSLPSAKKDRLFEDAVSIPMKVTDDKEELMDELRNPIWLAARFERLSEITYADGKTTIADKCPAIKKYVELFNEKGVEYFVEKQNTNGEFPLTTEYLRYAVIGELLFDCTEVSVKKDVTTKYVWRLDETDAYLADGTFDLGEIKAIKKEYVEDDDYNDVIVITHITKEKGKVLYVEYFDVYDRAPVILDDGGSKVTPKQDEPGTPGKDPSDEPGTPGKDPSDEPGTPGKDPDKPDPGKKYDKDKTKGTQGSLVAPNDTSGPGPDTNNGVGAQTSTEDEATNSNHMTYEEYKKAIEEIKESNQGQKDAGQQDNSTNDGNNNVKVHVDDNSANGTGNGGIDTPTPVKEEEAKTSEGAPLANNENNPAGSWGGPAD